MKKQLPLKNEDVFSKLFPGHKVAVLDQSQLRFKS